MSVQKFKYVTYTINCEIPVQASLFDTQSFVEFLTTRFRPTKTGKAGNVGQFSTDFTPEQNKAAIGKSVIISHNKEMTKVYVHTKTPLCKRYLKFLTKKFLKKNQLRDIIRLSSTATRRQLDLKFFITMDDDELDEENVE